jgi:hypothetical protein
MERARSYILAAAVLIAGLLAQPLAGNMLQARFGAFWPKVLLQTDKPTAWDVGLQYGLLVDEKVGVGAGIDLFWNRTVAETEVATGVYKVTFEEKTYMFPVYAYLYFDPLSRLIVHPAATFQVGYNSMIYKYDNADEVAAGDTVTYDPDGYYFGLYLKVAADAMVNLGESSAIFLGVDYQWAKPRSATDDETGTYRKRNMGGIGLRVGLKLNL